MEFGGEGSGPRDKSKLGAKKSLGRRSWISYQRGVIADLWRLDDYKRLSFKKTSTMLQIGLSDKMVTSQSGKLPLFRYTTTPARAMCAPR